MTRPRRDPIGGQADALQHLDRLVDPVSLAVAISKLPPTSALVAAARSGAEIAEARWERREQLRQAGKDIAAGLDPSWRRWADNYLPYEELERRRAELPPPRRSEPDPELAAAFAVAAAACQAAQTRVVSSNELADDDAEDNRSERPAIRHGPAVDCGE